MNFCAPNSTTSGNSETITLYAPPVAGKVFPVIASVNKAQSPIAAVADVATVPTWTKFLPATRAIAVEWSASVVVTVVLSDSVATISSIVAPASACISTITGTATVTPLAINALATSKSKSKSSNLILESLLNKTLKFLLVSKLLALIALTSVWTALW